MDLAALHAAPSVPGPLASDTSLFESCAIPNLQAYIDVTDLAEKELDEQRRCGFVGWSEATEWVRRNDNASAHDPRWRPDPTDTLDAHLLAAAAVCARLRCSVFEATGYRMSAGIAHSKLVAKLASATHKPNKQTIIPRAAVPLVMATLPIREVRGLGGQLGQRVAQQLGLTFAGELAGVALDELRATFGGETARWLHSICTGGLDEPVTPSIAPKSLNAFKSFAPTSDPVTITRWVDLLAAELVQRMAEDRTNWARAPKRLKVQYRGALRSDHRDNWVAGRTGDLTAMHSRQVALPGGGSTRPPTAKQLSTAALALLPGKNCSAAASTAQVDERREQGKTSGVAWPVLTRLALSVCDFVSCDFGRGVASYFEVCRNNEGIGDLRHVDGASAVEETVERQGPISHGERAPCAHECMIVPWDDASGEEDEDMADADVEDANFEDAMRPPSEAQEVQTPWPLDKHDAGQAVAGGNGQSEGAEQSLRDWQCNRCTFVNNALLPSCEMCQEQRGGKPQTASPSSKQKAPLRGGTQSKAKRAKPSAQPSTRQLSSYGFVADSPRNL